MDIGSKLYIIYFELFEKELEKLIRKICDLSEEKIFKESKILLESSITSIINSYRLLEKDDFIDSLSLLRCAFESILFSLAIKVDSKIYTRYKSYNDQAFIEYLKKNGTIINNKKEYKDIASPNNIRIAISKNHGRIFKSFISEDDFKSAKTEFDNFYHYLCDFTHPSIVKTYVYKIQNDVNNLDSIKYIFKLNIMYCEMLLIHSIMFFLDDYKNIDDYYDLYFIIILLSANKVGNIKKIKEVLKKYDEYLYLDITKKYLNKNKDKAKEIEKEIDKIKNNPNASKMLVGIMENVIKNFNAYDVWNKYWSS